MTNMTPTLTTSETDVQAFVPAKKARKTHYIAVTSGKGGVGKSTLAVNISLELGELGNRTMLLDADFGLANADLLCGVTPKYHLGHVVAGLKEPHEISIPLSEMVSLIPGGSGIEDLANLSNAKHSYLFQKLDSMQDEADFMLIDTGAGIAENVLGVLLSAPKIIIVTTPEPTSIVDAYATIKAILRQAPTKSISVIVNDVVGAGGAEQVFLQINSAVQGFLNNKVELLGMIPYDSQVSKAICDQTPIVQCAPNSPASRAIRLVAKQLHTQFQKDMSLPGASFWNLLSED